MSDPYRISVYFFERNRHAADFHIRDFLGHLKRHLRQVCDVDQQKGTLAALL